MNFKGRTVDCLRFSIHLSVIFFREILVSGKNNFYRQMYRKLKVIKRSDSSAGEALKFCQKSPLPSSFRLRFTFRRPHSNFTEPPFETCCFISLVFKAWIPYFIAVYT